ncbi:hypothetical protein [Nocardioides sp. NPDC127503]|uniref:hypothetical protein n=1 Tax=Nocardioides sp. NPDC127503 TaxID=3154516 RepID=UPI00331D473C
MPSLTDRSWVLFDQIVAEAPKRDESPWDADERFAPDFDTLALLLGVPLALKAKPRTRVPALALDVWVAYELRRAGFHPDRVWPRATAPRVLPADVGRFVNSLPKKLQEEMRARLVNGRSGGTTSASANLLGKNYIKQVDVVMSTWSTGPELMISTKRMDSSFGKNAANRIEESYGDAKNLSLRHPQAALGFFYLLGSSAFHEEPETAARLIDLLQKLGREDDAYGAVGLVVPEWDVIAPTSDGSEEDPAPMTLDDDILGIDEEEASAEEASSVEDAAPVDDVAPVHVDDLPRVLLRHDLVPDELSPARFFEVMAATVLVNTPISLHPEARARAPKDLDRRVRENFLY